MLESKVASGYFAKAMAFDTANGVAIIHNKVTKIDLVIRDDKSYIPRALAQKLFGDAPQTKQVQMTCINYVPLREYAAAAGYDVQWHASGVAFVSKQPIDFVTDAPNIGFAIRIFGLSSETDRVTGNDAAISQIYLNGEPLEGYSPGIYYYYVLDAGGDFDITCDSQYDITITENADDTVAIKVKSNKYAATYTIYKNTTTQPTAGKDDILVTVSAEPQPENGKEHVLDGDLSTRWSAEGTQWVCLDFQEEKTVEKMYLAWYLGTQRYTTFDVEISNDAENWEKVFSGISSGKTELPESVRTGVFTARYVKVTCRGTNVGTWNSVTEAEFEFKE